MKAILVDTGPLYAETDKSDRYHHQACTELQTLNQSKAHLLVPYPILMEAHKLVLYKGGNRAAASFMQRLLSGTNVINPTVKDYQHAYNLVGQFPDQTITLFDALLATLSKEMNLPVWTYDYHFDVMQVEVWR